MIAFFFFVVEAAVSDDSSVAVSSGIQASSLSSWIIIESEYSTLRGAGMNAPLGVVVVVVEQTCRRFRPAGRS